MGRDSTCFYVRPDEMERPFQVWRHEVGAPTASDVLVYQEDDERFFVSVGLSLTEAWIHINSGSKVTTEELLLPAADPTRAPIVVQPREQDVEYDVTHAPTPSEGDRFVILTNAGGAVNFALVTARLDALGREHWVELVPHRPDVKLEGVSAFEHHLVRYERREGVRRIIVMPYDGSPERELAMPEAVYDTGPATNAEFTTTAAAVLLHLAGDPHDGVRGRPLQRGPHGPQGHRGARGPRPRRLRDGPAVGHRRRRHAGAHLLRAPRRRRPRRLGPVPALRLRLLRGLDRPWVLQPAAVAARPRLRVRHRPRARRRGDGTPWYDDGKMLHKRNTFTDFIAAAEHLVAQGYTAPDRLAARGGSAGGLLMGAVTNLRPDLFAAVVAEVPFVDCLTTILDETLPLTVTEWEEWGNPVTDPDVYAYMKGYSPYDNVTPQPYPSILATGGLNDPRVSYWEPTKWVQALRAATTSGRPVYLKTELGAGHQGPSGRYDAWRDEAFVYAFLLDALGRV